MDVRADEFMWEEVGVLLFGLGDKLVLDAPGRVLYGVFLNLLDGTDVIVEVESCPTLSHLELFSPNWFSLGTSLDLDFPCLLPIFAFRRCDEICELEN